MRGKCSQIWKENSCCSFYHFQRTPLYNLPTGNDIMGTLLDWMRLKFFFQFETESDVFWVKYLGLVFFWVDFLGVLPSVGVLLVLCDSGEDSVKWWIVQRHRLGRCNCVFSSSAFYSKSIQVSPVQSARYYWVVISVKVASASTRITVNSWVQLSAPEEEASSGKLLYFLILLPPPAVFTPLACCGDYFSDAWQDFVCSSNLVEFGQ